MTKLSKTAFQAQVPADITDGSAGQNSAADVRKQLLDLSDSVPIFGEALDGGFTATAPDLGTIATGTLTPSGVDGQLQHYTNGGAHTLEVPAADTVIDILVTNNASAGAITTSAYGYQNGDALTTTDGHKFILHIERINGFSRLSVEKLQ